MKDYTYPVVVIEGFDCYFVQLLVVAAAAPAAAALDDVDDASLSEGNLLLHMDGMIRGEFCWFYCQNDIKL